MILTTTREAQEEQGAGGNPPPLALSAQAGGRGVHNYIGIQRPKIIWRPHGSAKIKNTGPGCRNAHTLLALCMASPAQPITCAHASCSARVLLHSGCPTPTSWS